jgi:prevent-host-death family protein
MRADLPILVDMEGLGLTLFRTVRVILSELYVLRYHCGMSQVAITEARGRLASIIDDARTEPVYLTRHNRPVAAVVDSALLEQLLEDAEELADIRAVDAAWEETERLDETPIPWEDVKRDLGLTP